tara:strand:- start:1903 stop:2178 length:276 start_codon:yes stop_codon:yes gene_type:complete
MNQPTQNTIDALKILEPYRFNVWALMGNDKRLVRQKIMSAFLGFKLPISKSGIMVIREELFDRLNAQGNCLAAKETDIVIKSRGILNGMEA